MAAHEVTEDASTKASRDFSSGYQMPRIKLSHWLGYDESAALILGNKLLLSQMAGMKTTALCRMMGRLRDPLWGRARVAAGARGAAGFCPSPSPGTEGSCPVLILHPSLGSHCSPNPRWILPRAQLPLLPGWMGPNTAPVQAWGWPQPGRWGWKEHPRGLEHPRVLEHFRRERHWEGT